MDSRDCLRSSCLTGCDHAREVPPRVAEEVRCYAGLARGEILPVDMRESPVARESSEWVNPSHRTAKHSLGFIMDTELARQEEIASSDRNCTLITGFDAMVVSPASTDGRAREAAYASSGEMRPTARQHYREKSRLEATSSPARVSVSASAALITKAPTVRSTTNGMATSTKPATGRAKKSSSMTYEERRLARKCTIDGCFNYNINKGLCFRHGGGKQCTISGCDASAKIAGRCWKHGGSVQCNVKGCDRRGKSRGRCWAHGGGTKCQGDSCEKIAVSNGFCWAHGGGKRCLFDGCQRPAYERTCNFCPKHYDQYKDGNEAMEV